MATPSTILSCPPLCPRGPLLEPWTQICRDPSQIGQNHDPTAHIAFWKKPSCPPTLARYSRGVLFGVASLRKVSGKREKLFLRKLMRPLFLRCTQRDPNSAAFGSLPGTHTRPPPGCAPAGLSPWASGARGFSGSKQFQFCHLDTSRQIYLTSTGYKK